MLSVGLVGFGYAGRTFHAPLITNTERLVLDAIVQRHGDAAARAYPRARVFRSVDEMLASSAVELVVVATSNATHFAVAQQCLHAGKNVVVDKPFATTAAEARLLVELARERGKVLSVFHNRRWDGDFLTLQKLLREQTLGDVKRAELAFDRFRPLVDTNAWRQRDEPGSGLFFDLAPHLIDQALVAFGEPAVVTASIRRERASAQIDDAFDVAFDYSSGLRVTLGASMLACAARPRFAVHGTRGSWTKHQLDPQEAGLKRGELPGPAGWTQRPDDAPGTLTRCMDSNVAAEQVPNLRGNYLAYYENVRDAIAGTAKLAVTPEQGLRVMELMEICRQSSEQKRTISVTT